MQKMRLRQARRHRKTLRAMQGKAAAILERSQESWRHSRWRAAGGYRWREDEEEIKKHFVDTNKMILNDSDIFVSSSKTVSSYYFFLHNVFNKESNSVESLITLYSLASRNTFS